MIELVLSFLLSVQLWHVDAKRPLDERRAYLTPAATAMHYVAVQKQIGASEWDYSERIVWLSTLGRFESGFADLIGQDKCSEFAKLYGPDCDGGRAKTWWQCQYGVCPNAHREAPGSLRQMISGAGAALDHGGKAWRKCGRTMRGAFSGYRQMRCNESFADERAARYRILLKRFRKMAGESREMLARR